MRVLSSLAVVALFALIASGSFAAPPKTKPAPPADPNVFRTDSDPATTRTPWFTLRPGQFPPEKSAHAISGELIAVDAINRTGVLRPDRTDAQRRGDWDLPLPFVMLPFGSISYHGAPAELRDIPLGTHLHGQFYTWGNVTPPSNLIEVTRRTEDSVFGRVLKLEDDFSHAQRLGRTWRVDAVALDAGTLTVTGMSADGKADAKPIVYQINPVTRVWKGRAVGTLNDVAVGQSIAMNLTYCSLKGPGRVAEIWLDDQSRALATEHQLEVHRQFAREHGLAAWIDEVDNKQSIVTATFFSGVDPVLLAEFKANEGMTAATAEESLRTYDQINDRKGGSVVEILKAEALPGSSGVKIKFKASMLLEGFRPGKIVRLWAGKWKVDDLPREERLYQ